MHASPPTPALRWPALLIWTAVWILLLAADSWLDLYNLSLLLLTGSAAASLFLAPSWSIAASTASVIAFNWLFVPPRGSFHVDLPQHLLLLVSMVVVNGLIAVLMALQRRATERSYDQRVRTALLTSLSHDFRTPLATIIGAASTLRLRFAQLSDAQKRQQVDVVFEQASQLSRITDNVLQLVRLDAPQVSLARDWESAEEIVGNAVSLGRQHAPGRTLTAGVDGGLPLLWCDALLVVQLLENLIDNAVRYSPPHSSVEISAFQAGSSIAFSVADRGPGVSIDMPAASMRASTISPDAPGAPAVAATASTGGPARIVPGATPASGAGAGIGLSLCRLIAGLHDGKLEILPRDGGGSVATLFLPLQDGPAPQVEQAA